MTEAVAQGQNPEHMMLSSLPAWQACCSNLHCEENQRDAVQIFMKVTAGKEGLLIQMRLRERLQEWAVISSAFSHARSKLKIIHKSIRSPGSRQRTMMQLKTTLVINHAAMLSWWASSCEQWWSVPPRCVHVYVSAAGNSSWLDSPHYLKRWHGRFIFRVLMVAESSNKAEVKCKREMPVQNHFYYLRGVVVSIRATYRWGGSNRTRLAAAFRSLLLARLFDSECDRKKGKVTM